MCDSENISLVRNKGLILLLSVNTLSKGAYPTRKRAYLSSNVCLADSNSLI